MDEAFTPPHDPDRHGVSMRRKSSWLVALAAVAVVGGQAHARQPSRTPQGRSAACVWAAAPGEVRARMIAASPSTRQMSAALSNPLTVRMAKACDLRLSKDGVQLIVYALMSNAMEIGAEDKLKARYGIEHDRLAGVWEHVPAYARLSLSTAIRPPGRLTPGTMASLRASASALDLREAPAVELLFAYLAGRAIRERLSRDDLERW